MRLIDADALKDFINRQLAMTARTAVVMNAKDFFENIVENAPTIDLSEQAKRDIATIIENEMDMRVLADRKHGKWETKPFYGKDFEEVPNHVWCICPFCKNKLGVFEKGNYYHFCPVCGARMDGE